MALSLLFVAMALGFTGGIVGLLSGSSPMRRGLRQILIGLGAAGITYGLYRNTQRTQPWSEAAGEVASGTGTGLLQSVPVYGRVPAQTTPGAGIYSDTVVATVTY